MMQVLYRKYRPRDFNDVIGQNHITQTLKNEIAAGRPAHAYLFTGSRGTGKTSCSKIIAKAVNCLQSVEGNPCGVCPICLGIDSGSLLDVVEIDAASNNGVDDVRRLREEAQFTPSVCRYRVYIIDEVHMLSAAAFNALLKIMEEPPPHVLFILATTEAHKLPPTIISRCQRFDFKRIDIKDIAGRLLNISGREGIAITEGATHLIGKIAEGGMRDALSLLDVCRSYSHEVDETVVAQAAGLVIEDALFAIVDTVKQGDIPKILTILDEAASLSVDYERLTGQLIAHYRTLMLLKAADGDASVADILPQQQEKFASQQKNDTMGHIMYCLGVLQEAITRMSRTTRPATELEMAIIRMTDTTLDASGKAILARLERLEDRVATGGTAPYAAATTTDAAPQAAPNAILARLEQLESRMAAGGTAPPVQAAQAAPQIAQTPTSPDNAFGGTPSALQEVLPLAQWKEIISKLQKKNKALYGALSASKAYICEDLILIQSEDEFFINLIRNNEYAKLSLHEAIIETTGKKHRIGPYKDDKYMVKQKQADPLGGLIVQAQQSDVSVVVK